MSMVLISVTEAICDRGTRIQGSKGELIGDMNTFVSPTPLIPRHALISRRSSISSPVLRQSTTHQTKEEVMEVEMPDSHEHS